MKILYAFFKQSKPRTGLSSIFLISYLIIGLIGTTAAIWPRTFIIHLMNEAAQRLQLYLHHNFSFCIIKLSK